MPTQKSFLIFVVGSAALEYNGRSADSCKRFDEKPATSGAANLRSTINYSVSFLTHSKYFSLELTGIFTMQGTS